ncbi:MAG: hypothetical protein E7241_00395 [Lachnospiraceae bacterium]|nr:hypothetical protein [Lachnospiraceae bacterium]
MLFNGAIVHNQIEQYYNISSFRDSETATARTSMFYNAYLDMDSLIIIVKPAELVQCLSKANNSIIICTNKPEVTPDPGNNALIIIDDDVAAPLCHNIVNHIINIFLEWEGKMNDILYNKGTFKDMINLIASLVDMPIALTDTDFRYIAYSDNSTPYMDMVDENEQLPLKFANELLLSPNYSRLTQHKEAFYCSYPRKSILKNVYHNGDYIGRLATLVDPERDDLDYLIAMFDIVAPFLEGLYSQYGSFDNKNELLNAFHLSLADILDGKAIDQSNWDIYLKMFNSRPEDEWEVYILARVYSERALYRTTYLCAQIEHMWQETISLYHNDQIIILRNISLGDRQGREDFESNLEHFLTVSSLEAGRSRRFDSIHNYHQIFDARAQADFSLARGKTKKSEDLIYYYEDFALDFMLTQNISNYSASQICHPALLILAAYDKEHNTQYAHTLRVYAEERYNAVLAAKRLFIHRSSFLKRMNRIDELTGINLEDPKERLYLETSLYLYV